jgi:predicted amidohydrolase
MSIRVSICQVRVKENFPKNNFKVLEEKIKEAKKEGSNLCIFPEDFLFGIIRDQAELKEVGAQYNAWVKKLCELAKLHSIDLVPGSLPKKVRDRVFNTTLYINNNGIVLGEHYKANLWLTERSSYDIGNKELEVFDTLLGRTGLLICWDTMHDNAFKELIKKGAEWVIAPAFWTNHHSLTSKKERGTVSVRYPKAYERKLLKSIIYFRAQSYNIALIFCNFGGRTSYVDKDSDEVKLNSAHSSQIVGPLATPEYLVPSKSGVYHLDIDLDSVRGAIRDNEVFFGRRQDISSDYPNN